VLHAIALERCKITICLNVRAMQVKKKNILKQALLLARDKPSSAKMNVVIPTKAQIPLDCFTKISFQFDIMLTVYHYVSQ
jgi:hypothetical protein